MKSKILFSLLPMIFISLLVSVYIYKTGVSTDSRIEKAIEITHIVTAEELQMVSMSEALRGYLLDPKNTKEYDRKKAADQKYADLAASLGLLTKDSKEIFNLNEEMAKLDADALDKIENKLAEMVNSDRAKVLEYYTKEYVPVREKQNTNFNKLKELSFAYSQNTINQINKQKKLEAILTIIVILCGSFIGSFVTYYVSHAVNKSASKIFDSIYTLSEQLSDTAETLSNKSKELSDATNHEASAIQETASSLHEVTAMVQRNTDNATKTRDLSNSSRIASHKGLESVQKMKVAMSEINRTQEDIISRVDDGNKKIGDIVGMISAIGEKTKIINDIVFQTKILSFNASVEAARAGEQGKGFSVVAEEVGKLALMSGKAAQEITEMLDESMRRVSSIVDETKANVEKIVYEGKDKISKGTIIANDCAQGLEEVVKKIEEVDKTIDEISVASHEQSQGVSEINQAVAQLDSSTQLNSAIAKETFESSKNLNERSNDLRAMVDNLVVIFRGKKA